MKLEVPVLFGFLAVLTSVEGLKSYTNGHQMIPSQYEKEKGYHQYSSQTRKHIFSYRNPYAVDGVDGRVISGRIGQGNKFSYTAVRKDYHHPVKHVEIKKPHAMKYATRNFGNFDPVENIIQQHKGLLHSIENLIVDAIFTSEQNNSKQIKKEKTKHIGMDSGANKGIKKIEKSEGKTVFKDKKVISKNVGFGNLSTKTTKQITSRINKQAVKSKEKTILDKDKTADTEKIVDREPAADADRKSTVFKDAVHKGLSINTKQMGLKENKKAKNTGTEPTVTESTVEPAETPEALAAQELGFAVPYGSDYYCACMIGCPTGTVYRGNCGSQWTFGIQTSMCCLETFYSDYDDDDR